MVPKEVMKEILLEQQRKINDSKGRGLVVREKLDEAKKFIGLKHCIIITGVRRCGKSVFLSQIMRESSNSHYYVNFEDERLAYFELEDFNRLYEACIGLFGKANTFFLDEVQNIPGWERWVRRMYEDGFKFFITGSNARLLSKELATLLTGRHLQISIFPFSFREFLKFHRFGLTKEDAYITERRVIITKLFSEYLSKGGFPEYLKYGNIEILQGYFNDIIQRDIIERYKVKGIRQLKELARYLLTNTGNLATYNQLRKVTEIKSVNTVISYLSYLENVYLLFRVPYFSYSLRKQTTNPFKVYAIDTGLRNSVSFKFSEDLGRVYETIVAIQLRRQDKEAYYWKNSLNEEVDFVIKAGKIEQLIQVCYDIHNDTVKERELISLAKAGRELKCRNLLVITDDYEAEEKVKGKTISFIPLWKWLLA